MIPQAKICFPNNVTVERKPVAQFMKNEGDVNLTLSDHIDYDCRNLSKHEYVYYALLLM